MLAPIKHLLASKRIILASRSPRRLQLIERIGLNVEIVPSNFEENLNPRDYKEISDFVESTALGKAEEVYNRIKSESPEADLLIIAADTMVTLDNEIFGKPEDAKDAIRILTMLSGKCNISYTGVVLKHEEGIVKFTESAKVCFGKLRKDQIEAYVDSGEPLDKAGAFGICGLGAAMIEKVDGDFYTIMGLPLYRLSCELCQLFECKNDLKT